MFKFPTPSTRSIAPSLEDLPSSLVIEILSRLSDVTDLVSCRLVSKTLNVLSYDVRSLNFVYSASRHQKWTGGWPREYPDPNVLTPYRTVMANMVRSCSNIETLSISVEIDSQRCGLDCFPADPRHMNHWLPSIGHRLKSLSIYAEEAPSTYAHTWALISNCCPNLLELEVKGVGLEMNGLKPMPKLTSLKLRRIKVKDEMLNKFEDYFPSLQFLKLRELRGTQVPRIHLPIVKNLQLGVRAHIDHLTIVAPYLIQLKLVCYRPKSLVLETPSLSDFHLAFDMLTEQIVNQEFSCLVRLDLRSSKLFTTINTFPTCRTVKTLVLDSIKYKPIRQPMLRFDMLFVAFPNLCSLHLGPGAWSEMERGLLFHGLESRNGMEGLTEITAHFVVENVDATFSLMRYILESCTALSFITFILRNGIHWNIFTRLKSLCEKCRRDWQRIRWRWGVWQPRLEPTYSSWKKEKEDVWMEEEYGQSRNAWIPYLE